MIVQCPRAFGSQLWIARREFCSWSGQHQIPRESKFRLPCLALSKNQPLGIDDHKTSWLQCLQSFARHSDEERKNWFGSAQIAIGLFVCFFCQFPRTSPVQFYDAEKMKFLCGKRQPSGVWRFFACRQSTSERSIDTEMGKKACNAVEIHYVGRFLLLFCCRDHLLRLDDEEGKQAAVEVFFLNRKSKSSRAFLCSFNST